MFTIPNTNAVSIYVTIFFGFATIIFVFRLWLKASCGKFVSDVKMDGKTVIVTGANSGIGKETARDLAKRGARVIMACRNLTTANEARDSIVNETGNNNIVVKSLDLSSFKSIREFAADILKTEKQLDVLVHNAGYQGSFNKAVSADGIEMTMATNHYSTFLLTHLLIDLMKKSEPSRIVVVASMMHKWSTFNPYSKESINPTKYFHGQNNYNNSKFANMLFTFELAKRLKGTKVTANCLNPGLVYTNLFRHTPFPLNIIAKCYKMFFKTPEEGTQTSNYLAVSPDLATVTGKYFSDCKEIETSVDAQNTEWWSAFWTESMTMCKLTDNDPKI